MPLTEGAGDYPAIPEPMGQPDSDGTQEFCNYSQNLTSFCTGLGTEVVWVLSGTVQVRGVIDMHNY